MGVVRFNNGGLVLPFDERRPVALTHRRTFLFKNFTKRNKDQWSYFCWSGFIATGIIVVPLDIDIGVVFVVGIVKYGIAVKSNAVPGPNEPAGIAN